jgi:hypothetical protein
MATTVKQNGTPKKPATSSTPIKQKLAEEAKGQPSPSPKKEEKPPIMTPISLEAKIEHFEKLRGIANQRERVVETLSSLSKFRYNQGDSSIFKITDGNGLEFITSNTNLINLVTQEVQHVLVKRKSELEQQILDFSL